MDPSSKDRERTSGAHVVAIPYPGRGHINPMLNLCAQLASESDAAPTITFVVTEEWLRLLGSDSKPLPSNLQLCTIPNVIPSERERGADLIGFLVAVMTKMEDPFERLLDRLEPPPTTIITDTFLLWAIKVGNRRNIPVASLWTMSATVFSLHHHYDLLVENNHHTADVFERGDARVDYIPGVSSIRTVDLPAMLNPIYQHGHQLLRRIFSWTDRPQYLLFTSVYELESETIDALKRSNLPIPIRTIGPTIPFHNLQNDVALGRISSSSSGSSSNYLQWLDDQPAGSVLYLSMGSFYALPTAQTEEIAAGLCDGGIRYLWAAREEPFRGEMGVVVPWCDQLRVLCHPSVGGFWTHCGWSSIMEGAFAGVPMLTFPMIADQKTNSNTVVEDWKIGWRVRKENLAGGLIPRGEIAGLVRRFMDSEDDEVREIRRRAEGLRSAIRLAIGEGGSSAANLRAVTEKILQCHKSSSDIAT